MCDLKLLKDVDGKYSACHPDSDEFSLEIRNVPDIDTEYPPMNTIKAIKFMLGNLNVTCKSADYRTIKKRFLKLFTLY